jgi:hypothetical protein
VTAVSLATMILPGVSMVNLTAVIAQLEAERERVHKEVQRIDAALAALGSSSKRTVTPASRRRIAAAQRARWAKVKRRA